MRVSRSAVIDAPIDAVWALLRDFNSHARWHPAIAESEIEHYLPPDAVGCVRRFALRDGGGLREQLLALSDRERTLRYCILSGTIPLRDYVATIRLREVTGSRRTFWTWESRFVTPPGREAELSDLVARGVYDAGFSGLRAHLRSGGVPFGPSASADAMAVVIDAHGGPEVMRYRRWPVRDPGPGEARIRHAAIGVNFIDIYVRTGRFRMIDPPGVPGMEAAGVVVSVGHGVDHICAGQRVGYACAPPGAYATERTMPADLVLPLPDDIDDATTAAALLKGMTAAFLLHDVHPVRAGESVLVHASSGATGSLLAQWASALGARVIGVVGTEAKAPLAHANGCAVVIVGMDALSGRVREATDGRGVDVAYDGVGAASFAASYAALATRGHLVSFGQASGDIPPVDISAFAEKSARVSRPNFGHYTGTRARAEHLRALLFAALRRGVLRVPPPTRMALSDAAAAHRALEARATQGATILLP